MRTDKSGRKALKRLYKMIDAQRDTTEALQREVKSLRSGVNHLHARRAEMEIDIRSLRPWWWRLMRQVWLWRRRRTRARMATALRDRAGVTASTGRKEAA
jgi:septal ring factor EnvC (AmiA/AmiB activator)